MPQSPYCARAAAAGRWAGWAPARTGAVPASRRAAARRSLRLCMRRTFFGERKREGAGFWPGPFVGLPDVDAVGGRQIEPVAGPHVEGAVPGVDVADDAVHPPLRRAV